MCNWCPINLELSHSSCWSFLVCDGWTGGIEEEACAFVWCWQGFFPCIFIRSFWFILCKFFFYYCCPLNFVWGKADIGGFVKLSDAGTVNLLSQSYGVYNINELGLQKWPVDDTDHGEKTYRCASHEMRVFGAIGTGASSVVQRAIHIPTHRIIALKKINIFEKVCNFHFNVFFPLIFASFTQLLICLQGNTPSE